MSLPKTLSMNIINQLNAPPQTTALQKVFILLGLGTFVALAALTASLPLPLIGNQAKVDVPPATDDGSSEVNAGDTAWMIVAAFFGILLTPALAYLYANLYGRTSSFSVQVSIIIGAMITVLWIVLTFSLTYAKDANGDQILGIPKYYYMFAHVGATPDGTYTETIPFSIFAIFELSFPILAASIVTSALIDRVNVYGLLFFIGVWHICYWTPIAHITWNSRGFFFENEIEDFSGGLVVHMTAGITAVTANLFLNWIQAPKVEPRRPSDPENLVFAALLVWFLSFGINAGKAHSADYTATQSVVNTIAGVTSGVVLNYYFDIMTGVDITDVTLVNSLLLGIISTTPCSGVVTVGGSMVVSCITTMTVRAFDRFIFKTAANDGAYSIGVLHGLGGSTAFLFTALVSHDWIAPGIALNGLTAGVDVAMRHHIAAVLAMWICGFCALLFGLAVCNLIVPLSKSKQSPKGDYAPTPLGPFGGNNHAEEAAPEAAPAAQEEVPAENA